MKNIIEVWKPKYSTREVLVATHRIVTGDNYVKITKDSAYKNTLLKFNSEMSKKYPTQKNGRGTVVVIPLRDFEIINENQI